MRLQILAAGKMKAGPERELFARYADRIGKAGRSLHFDGPSVVEIPESKLQTARERKSEEAHQLLGKVDAGSAIILLDELGRDVSSKEFANLLAAYQNDGVGTLGFAIGGPDGLGDEFRARSNRTIRFGSMTWPHQFVRIMLAEQLYRAITILSGHPYHRE